MKLNWRNQMEIHLFIHSWEAQLITINHRKYSETGCFTCALQRRMIQLTVVHCQDNRNSVIIEAENNDANCHHVCVSSRSTFKLCHEKLKHSGSGHESFWWTMSSPCIRFQHFLLRSSVSDVIHLPAAGRWWRFTVHSSQFTVPSTPYTWIYANIYESIFYISFRFAAAVINMSAI